MDFCFTFSEDDLDKTHGTELKAKIDVKKQDMLEDD